MLLKTLVREMGNSTVLEVGCGSASMSHFFREYIGVDPSLYALKVARKNGAEYLVRAVGEYLPFRDKCFDYVFSQGLIEHLEDPVQVLKEKVRVAKRKVFFSVPRRGGLLHFLWSLLRALKLERFYPFPDEKYYGRDSFNRLGFKAKSRLLTTWLYEKVLGDG
jgi:ubiquinone/menaquinone biosynthesis C-methylase UbiE